MSVHLLPLPSTCVHKQRRRSLVIHVHSVPNKSNSFRIPICHHHPTAVNYYCHHIEIPIERLPSTCGQGICALLFLLALPANLSALFPSRMMIGLIGYLTLLRTAYRWWSLTDPNRSTAISALWSVSILGILIWQLIKYWGWSERTWLHMLPIKAPSLLILQVQYHAILFLYCQKRCLMLNNPIVSINDAVSSLLSTPYYSCRDQHWDRPKRLLASTSS